MKMKIYINTFLRDPSPPSHNHATNYKSSPDTQCPSTELLWARRIYSARIKKWDTMAGRKIGVDALKQKRNIQLH